MSKINSNYVNEKGQFRDDTFLPYLTTKLDLFLSRSCDIINKILNFAKPAI